MTMPNLPKPDKKEPVPGLHIWILPLWGLVKSILKTPPQADYAVRRPRKFSHSDFYIQVLSEDELERLNNFKAMKKQVEWLGGRYTAKAITHEILLPEQQLSDITIKYMEKGAPYLKAFSDHCLSLSHSGNYTVAALARTPDIRMGIDLEKIGLPPDKNFMKTAFTQKEIQEMGDRPQDIFRCWTLKEAYLKYIRMGFNENLHDVEIIQDKVFYRGEEQKVTCWSTQSVSDYMLSLVWSD